MNSTEINTSRTATINTPDHSTVTTTSNHSEVVTTPHRATLINTLAVVGFITLIGGSLWLAAYSTRFVPGVVSRIGSAAVYLGSVFTPAPTPTLSVVEATSTVLSFGEASSTISSSASSTVSKPVTPAEPKPVAQKTPGTETSGTYPIGGTAPTGLYGYPDFIVIIKAVGYLATSSADSFVATTTVPVGGRAAVSFTIKNVGTNVSGAWRFSASIPTQTSYIFESQPQQSLAPGDSIDYTLGFDQANRGADQMISVTANFDHAVTESNPNNNSASTKVTILGN